MTPGGKDEAADKALGQRDYNAALSEHAYDKVYVDFLTRYGVFCTLCVLYVVCCMVYRVCVVCAYAFV
ncbi:hypothetical protein EON65_30685 [archaeon]|nr:MAG: hypothetical protein EON65_30685 [archaeon]